jgi:hypothetical protein
VRKPRDKVFHLNCFTCCICRKQLSTGEQLYVLDDNKFVCKDNKNCKDFMLSKGYQIGKSQIYFSRSYEKNLTFKFQMMCVHVKEGFLVGLSIHLRFSSCPKNNIVQHYKKSIKLQPRYILNLVTKRD